jgi:UDP-glucose 4-epimerase
MDKNKIHLITGGAGFIGSHLVDQLLAAGYKVRVLDNFSVGRKENLAHHASNPNLEIIAGDVNDFDIVSSAMHEIDTVFHLAARADIVPSIEMPEVYYQANVNGTFNVMQAARKEEVRKVIYASSSSCYGMTDEIPTTEAAPTQPQYPYALTKYLGEQILFHWGQVYNIPTLAICIFNAYGPRARTKGTYGAVFGVFLAQIAANKPVTIVGDGEQKRDFIYVTDVANAFVMGAQSDIDGKRLNIGSGHPQSINHLVKLLKAKEIVHIPKRPGEPDITFANTTEVERDLNWEAKVPFEKGVDNMLADIAHYKDAPVWTISTIEAATKSWFKHLSE